MQVMTPGPMDMDEMSMNSFMPVVGPKGYLKFSFVVPDKPGEWTIGCFQQSGQHYLNGMKGTVTVIAGSA